MMNTGGERRDRIETLNPRHGLPARTMTWPTPTAYDRDTDGRYRFRLRRTLALRRYDFRALSYAAREVCGEEKVLNPRFVEWLMGLPTGWVSLDARSCAHIDDLEDAVLVSDDKEITASTTAWSPERPYTREDGYVDSSTPVLYGLSLCSGYGGLDLGVHAVLPCRTVCYVERELSVAAILAARMEEGTLDAAPIWDDVRSFDGRAWRGIVDIVTAGFPCQPFSNAGNRRGEDDARHLWPHILRIIGECGAPVVLLENVPGLLTVRAADGRTAAEIVVTDLEHAGYRVAGGIFSAAEVGAPHRRERVFILGVADTQDVDGWTGIGGTQAGVGSHRFWGWRSASSGKLLADASRGGRRGGTDDPLGHAVDRASAEGSGSTLPPFPPGPADHDAWRAVLAVRPDLAPALAEPASNGRGAARPDRYEQPAQRPDSAGAGVADANGARFRRRRDADHVGCAEQPGSDTGSTTYDNGSSSLWDGMLTESALCRVADGPPHRLGLSRRAQLRALGNGVVPQQATYAFIHLWEALNGPIAYDTRGEGR